MVPITKRRIAIGGSASEPAGTGIRLLGRKHVGTRLQRLIEKVAGGRGELNATTVRRHPFPGERGKEKRTYDSKKKDPGKKKLVAKMTR